MPEAVNVIEPGYPLLVEDGFKEPDKSPRLVQPRVILPGSSPYAASGSVGDKPGAYVVEDDEPATKVRPSSAIDEEINASETACEVKSEKFEPTCTDDGYGTAGAKPASLKKKRLK